MVVLSGPSGAGKNTIADAAIQEWGDAVHQLVTYTTRPPRSGEAGGVDYHFVDRATFHRLSSEGFFLESARVHGHYYGSPRMDVLRRIAAGEVVLLVLDIQGGLAVKKQYPDSVLAFVLPSRFEELGTRISQRGVTGHSFELRMRNARREIQAARKYDYIVINDDLEAAVCDFKAIVQAERCRASRRKAVVKSHPALHRASSPVKVK